MKTKHKIISAIVSLILCILVFYIFLPPINIFSKSFWKFLIFCAIAFGLPYFITEPPVSVFSNKPKSKKQLLKQIFKSTKGVFLALAFVPVFVLAIGSVFSSTFFHAKSYANVITVTEAIFEEDMEECDTVTNIALMDSESAAIIGNRTLGSLSQVVSQYEIGKTYTQINYKNAPQKVANLEYVDFFKWMNNKSNGIPGYVMVDPVNNTAQYVESKKPMIYAESGYFGDYLMRKLRFSYPTKIFDTPKFEIDDEGQPKYIIPCLKPRVFLFGATDVCGAIIFDPCTGDSQYYNVKDVPTWVDAVFNGNLAMEKYNWHGTLSGGYWNSVFSNVDCKRATDDFGYIVIDDDVWYFTGVTSTTSDESNIGFIISNARTGEYKYYPVIGAEEYSAMHAAEGEVQEKGYKASFPSLINVSGEATYIMVLKDNGGLVKLYALVNVENYSLVATAETQSEALSKYRNLLAKNGIFSESEVEETTPNQIITVKDVRIVLIDDISIAYITAETGEVYKKPIVSDESIMLISKGDSIKVFYSETEIPGIRELISWEKATPTQSDL